MAKTAPYCLLGQLGYHSRKNLHLRWHLKYVEGGYCSFCPPVWLQPCHIRMQGSADCALGYLSILHLNSSFTVTGNLLNYP